MIIPGIEPKFTECIVCHGAIERHEIHGIAHYTHVIPNLDCPQPKAILMSEYVKIALHVAADLITKPRFPGLDQFTLDEVSAQIVAWANEGPDQ